MNNYPMLKRPRKRLIYPSSETRLPNQWTQDIVSLGDVDKMFDGLDSKGEDFPSPSNEIHIPKHRVETPPPEELLEHPVVADGDHHKPLTPVSPELDIDSETPFKAHGPVKTSSPIEGNEIQHKNKQIRKEDNSASPVLFDCAVENKNLDTAEKLSKKHLHNNCRKDESNDSFFETLPEKSAFNKMSAQKKKRSPVRPKPSGPSVAPVSLEARLALPEKENAQVPTRVKHDMTSFLQKLRDAGQPKPTRAGLLQAKVMPPAPEPEPEDDFLILEDDAPLYVSIPSKSSRNKEKLSKTSSSDKETKDTTGEEHSADKLQDAEADHTKQGSQVFTEKKRKPKGKISESNLGASDKDPNVPAIVDSNDAVNLLERDKTKKKTQTQLIKGPSKDDNSPEYVGTDTDTDDVKPSKKTKRKGEKTLEKGSKPVKNNNGNSQRKRTRSKENRKKANKANAEADGPEEQSQEVHCDQSDDESPALVVNILEAKSTGDLEHVHLNPHMPCSSVEGTADEDSWGKWKRKQTGQWWMNCPQGPQQQLTVKKAKHVKKDSSPSRASLVKATTGTRKKNLTSSSSTNSPRQKPEKKVKKGILKRSRPLKWTSSEDSDEIFQESSQDRALDQDSESSPLLFPHKQSISSEEQIFPKTYQNSEKQSLKHKGPEGLLGSRDVTKRKRKSPGNWWQINSTAEDQEMLPSEPQQQKPKEIKAAGEKRKTPSVRSPSKPLEGATKQRKRSLATYTDICSAMTVSPSINRKTETKLKEQNNITSSLAAHNVVRMETNKSQRALDQFPSPDMLQESTSKVIRSGPSSMIALENYEEDDEESVLPLTTVQPALRTSDLCAPPLKPLALQPKDKVNLQDWLKSLWPITDHKQRGSEITPDYFEWYCYQGRALGIMVDLHLGPICHGKMLLGSFMKKPLWVDHSATTVFSLLTSSVSLIVDCNKSCYSAGQSFMVPPGHAYSIHNLSAQPAVFYFTRVYSEESDD